MVTPYYRKHLKLYKTYSLLSLKKLTEYKFNIITNTVSYAIMMTIAIFFWDLLYGSIDEIAHWKYPMLLMMIGFLNLTNAFWQMFWYSHVFGTDIVRGNLDLYLVRPIHPLYGLIMSRMQYFSLLPATLGLFLVLYTLLGNFEFELLKFLLAFFFIICSSLILVLVFVVINSLSFWFGSQKAVRKLFKSFLLIKKYPLDIFTMSVRTFFILFIPFFFFGTAPVLALTVWPIAETFRYILLVVGVLFLWIFLYIVVWKRGLKRYESSGS